MNLEKFEHHMLGTCKKVSHLAGVELFALFYTLPTKQVDSITKITLLALDIMVDFVDFVLYLLLNPRNIFLGH